MSQMTTYLDEPPTSASVIVSEDAPKNPVSKNAMKKAVKAERFAALKLERRAREKESKKEKKRQKAEKRAAGELDDEDGTETKRRAKKPRLQFGGTVVIDLGFDDMMNDKEVKSLCSQLAYTYSANRNAGFPFSLICTSLNGQTHQRLESLGDASYKRWSNTKWTEENYQTLWKGKESSTSALAEDRTTSSFGLDQEGYNTGSAQAAEEVSSDHVDQVPLIAQNSVVYLTADTEDELTELSPEETYIIGGICDHNRYKNLCLNKAKESCVRTARLPIGRYLASLPTRRILTVNQVFEILVKWVETRDWEESLYSVIPKRKFNQGGKGNHDANVNVTTVEDDADRDSAAAEQAEVDESS